MRNDDRSSVRPSVPNTSAIAATGVNAASRSRTFNRLASMRPNGNVYLGASLSLIGEEKQSSRIRMARYDVFDRVDGGDMPDFELIVQGDNSNASNAAGHGCHLFPSAAINFRPRLSSRSNQTALGLRPSLPIGIPTILLPAGDRGCRSGLTIHR
jgi:hypothetical protein